MWPGLYPLEHVVHPEGPEALHARFITKFPSAGVSWVSEVRGKSRTQDRWAGAALPKRRLAGPSRGLDHLPVTTAQGSLRGGKPAHAAPRQTGVQAWQPDSLLHPEGCQLCRRHKGSKGPSEAQTPSEGHLVSPEHEPRGRGVSAPCPT